MSMTNFSSLLVLCAPSSLSSSSGLVFVCTSRIRESAPRDVRSSSDRCVRADVPSVNLSGVASGM